MSIPLLLVVGGLKIYTLNVFIIIALLWAGFVVRKKASEYYIGEIEIYDGLLFMAILLFGFSKLVNGFGWGEYIHLGVWISLLIACLFVSFRSREKLFTLLDLGTLGLMMGYSWWELGLFWSGEVRGRTIGGVVISSELFLALSFLVVFILLWIIEGNYRTFEWYRGRKSTANTGFVFGLGLILFGAVRLLSDVVLAGEGLVAGMIGGLAIMGGSWVIYKQSGRNFWDDLSFLMKRGGGGQRK